jgi:hypothetical protein
MPAWQLPKKAYVAQQNISLPSHQSQQNKQNKTNDGLVEFHRIGRSMVHKAPDIMLVGFAGLVATELLERLSYRYASIIPPSIQMLLTKSFSLIEEKMEDLARMEWEIQRFIDKEMSQLQHYQDVFVNKFLKTEVLTRIDTDIAPLLYIATNDKNKVERIVKILKDFVVLIALRSSKYSVPLFLLQSLQQAIDYGEFMLRSAISSKSFMLNFYYRNFYLRGLLL